VVLKPISLPCTSYVYKIAGNPKAQKEGAEQGMVPAIETIEYVSARS